MTHMYDGLAVLFSYNAITIHHEVPRRSSENLNKAKHFKLGLIPGCLSGLEGELRFTGP